MKNLPLQFVLILAIIGFSACSSEQSQQKTAGDSPATHTKTLADAGPELAKEVAIKEAPAESPAEKASDSEKEMTPKDKTRNETSQKSDKEAATKKVTDSKPVKEKEPVKTAEKSDSEAVSTSTKPEKNSPATPKEVKTKPAEPKSETTTAPIKKKEKVEEEAPFVPGKPNHEIFDQLLRKHVSSSGKVNYKGFKSDIGNLKAYLKSLSENPIQSSWSRSEKMAYWINVYNAYTIKLIVDNYPVASITDLEGGKPWDKKWIKIDGKTYSLNNVENDILRPQYKDARIHFAVNCAAKSCPPLLNRAWTAANLESNFEKQAKAFINNSKYNKISEKEIQISKIFEWYAVDFGDIIEYINKYSDTKAKSSAKVKYLEYDWKLNE